MSTFNGIFLSLSHLGYFSHRRGCLLVLMGGQAEGQACADPGVRTPIERRKKDFFMHRILWLLFYKLLYAVIVYAYPFWHLKTYLLCIAIDPSHFINIILSFLASQLNYLSSHSIHFILYISFSIFQIINFNSMHVIISISFFSSLSLHLFSMLLFLCISLCTLSMRYLFILSV